MSTKKLTYVYKFGILEVIIFLQVKKVILGEYEEYMNKTLRNVSCLRVNRRNNVFSRRK